MELGVGVAARLGSVDSFAVIADGNRRGPGRSDILLEHAAHPAVVVVALRRSTGVLRMVPGVRIGRLLTGRIGDGVPQQTGQILKRSLGWTDAIVMLVAAAGRILRR